MAKWIEYKNRTSPNYRFTTTEIDDPMIADLKEMVKKYYKPSNIKSYGIRVRPRGWRDGNRHDTPLKNATHYDVYVREYYDYG